MKFDIFEFSSSNVLLKDNEDIYLGFRIATKEQKRSIPPRKASVSTENSASVF